MNTISKYIKKNIGSHYFILVTLCCVLSSNIFAQTGHDILRVYYDPLGSGQQTMKEENGNLYNDVRITVNGKAIEVPKGACGMQINWVSNWHWLKANGREFTKYESENMPSNGTGIQNKPACNRDVLHDINDSGFCFLVSAQR